MENTNAKADSHSTGAEENPNNNTNSGNNPANGDDAGNRPRRTPFTDLSQVDADLALARTLQEQERAYMMLRMEAIDGSDYGSWEADYDDDLDEDDYANASEEDYDGFGVEVDNEGDAEERDIAARLLALAGINEMIVEEDDDEEEDGGNSQDAWEEVDPDELSYEELIALGEVVGTESKGLPADTIASLPSISYKSQGTQEESSDSCVVCRLDYEDGDTLTVLSCKHSYHSECINNWLQINKVCPVCSAEVSTSGVS